MAFMTIQGLIKAFRTKRNALIRKYRQAYQLLDNDEAKEALHMRYQAKADQLEQWMMDELVAFYYGEEKKEVVDQSADAIRQGILERVASYSPIKGVLVKKRITKVDLAEYFATTSDEDWKREFQQVVDDWADDPFLFPDQTLPEARRILTLFGLIREGHLQILGDGRNRWVEITDLGRSYLKYLNMISPTRAPN